MINPLLDEQIRETFLIPPMMRIHLIGLAAITFLLFLFYPSQPVSYFLARSVKPEMFNITVYTVFTFTSFLAVKTSLSNIQDVKIISMDDWLLYGKAKGIIYFYGKLEFAFFYSLFLILLFLPDILVAGSISAVSPANMGAVIFILYLFIFDIYLSGMFLLFLFKKQYWFLTLILWCAIAVIVLIIPVILSVQYPVFYFVLLQNSVDIASDMKIPLAVLLTSAVALILGCRIRLAVSERSIHG